MNVLIAAEGTSGSTNTVVMWVIIGVVVLLLAAMIVLPMITNKRRAKEENTKRDSLCVGDTVMTIGGIVGVVKAVNEPAPGRKEFVLETGEEGSKTCITFDIKALYLIIDSAAKPEVSVSPSTSSEILKMSDAESDRKDGE